MLHQYFLVLLTVSPLLISGIPLAEKNDQQSCDINARFSSCPDGFCCVRGEFLFTETFCKQFGQAGQACSTRPSQFECKCEPGYQCATNIHGHVTSLFGKCYPIPGFSTDSVIDSVTSDMPTTDIDLTTVDNQNIVTVDNMVKWDNMFTTENMATQSYTTDGHLVQGTTDDSTQGHTKPDDGSVLVG